jgi:hypothetical protein
VGEVRWHVRPWATFNNGHSFWVPSIRKAGRPDVALAVKTLPPDLINVIFEFVKIVNHIRWGGGGLLFYWLALEVKCQKS